MTQRELVQKALDMRRYSYAPYSGFRVGAALECADGARCSGAAMWRSRLWILHHADERTALVKAVSEGHRRFVRAGGGGDSADYCRLCGACRQMLREFGADLQVLVPTGTAISGR